MNNENEIINALNDVYGEDIFRFTWAIDDNQALAVSRIIFRLVYNKTGDTLIKTEHQIRRSDRLKEEKIDKLIKYFNQQIMNNILFGIETKGKVYDPKTGRPIVTFADIKQQLTMNKNELSRETDKHRENEGRMLLPDNEKNKSGEPSINELPRIQRESKSENVWN